MHSDLYSDDLDSVTNNLRDSAKGSNDGYDVAFSLTGCEAHSVGTRSPRRAEKQSTIAPSNGEAELVAARSGARDRK